MTLVGMDSIAPNRVRDSSYPYRKSKELGVVLTMVVVQQEAHNADHPDDRRLVQSVQ